MQTQQNTIPPMFSLLHGDCLEKLATLRDNSIDAVVTDPPYGLGEAPDALTMLRDWLETGHHDVKSKRGFMGKTWDNFVPQPRVWHEVFRVLKPGGHVLAFAGTRTQDLMALGLRLAGFEIRDLVAWVYGSGFPKSHNLEGEWEGWGTALKPALEPITLARKPLEGTVAANMLKWHTGAINVDACRVPTSGEKLGGGAEKDVQSDKPEGWDRPWRNDPEAQKAHAERIRENVQKAEALGRWPANLIHDGSEEVVGLFPDTGKSTGGRTVKRSGGGNVGSGKASEASWTNDDPGYGDSGSAARFFQCCPPEALDLLFCRAKSIHGAWKLKNVSRAESSLPHQKQAVATVLNDAVIAASRGDKLLSDVKGLSTTVTGSEFEKLCETLITAMLISESVALPALSQDALIQNGCRVSVAAIQKPTDTMTIMISLPTFGGYAEPVTFSITPSSMALGVKDLSANRFRYCAKVSPSERNAGLSDLPDKEWKADGADRPFKPSKNNHPTVKPIALMRYLCRLITPPSGTILDPYLGSGSTGVAALQEGFDFIGIEREEEYFAIASARIDNVSKP